VEDILKKFTAISQDPYTYLDDWKKKNKKKIIGVYPMWIPEEIIHAADMLPVVIWRSNEPVTLGHSHVPPFNCGLTRSFVDDAVREKLSFLDGMIFYRMCLQAGSLSFIIENNAQPMPEYISELHLPGVFNKDAAIEDYLIEQLHSFAGEMEKVSNNKITDESLKNSIKVYNKSKKLLRKLFEIRRSSHGKIKAKEVQAIVHASMIMPKNRHNEMLEELLPQLEQRKTDGLSDQKIKVILAGALCQTVQSDILDLIEDLGIEVVDDDMYVGARYFAVDVDENCDGIKAVADRYMENEPVCPTKANWQKCWGDHLAEMFEKNGVDGVISLLIKFCPPHMCWYPAVREKLSDKKIPHLMIEVEHEVTSLEPIRTRLAAFVETVKGGL